MRAAVGILLFGAGAIIASGEPIGWNFPAGMMLAVAGFTLIKYDEHKEKQSQKNQ